MINHLKFGVAGIVLALGFSVGAGMAQAQEIQSRSLRFGHLSSDVSPLGQGSEKFAELVKEKSGGKIEVTVYHSGQLGSETQQIGATQAGLQDFVMLSSTPMSAVVQDLQVFDFPGIVSSREEAYKLLDGSVGQSILGQFSQKNLAGLAFFENGFRHLTNNTRPVESVADMSGLKIRVQQSPSTIDVFAALGANAVPMSWNELYTALETKLVDGQENPIATIEMARLQDVQKYMTLTGHVYGAHVVVASKRLMDLLSNDERSIIEEAIAEARDWQREFNMTSEQQLLEKMEADGLIVADFPDEEKARVAEIAQPILEKYAGQLSSGLLDQIRSQLAE